MGNQTTELHRPDSAARPLQSLLDAFRAEQSVQYRLEGAAHPALPERVRQRLGTAKETAQANAARLGQEHSAAYAEMSRAFTALQRSMTDTRQTLVRLRNLAHTWSTLVTPYSACRAHCTHCCHIPVALSTVEASIIGEAIGRSAKKFKNSRSVSDRKFGYGHPCPFLVEGRCSIYAHRPMSCRLQANLDEDELLCELIEDTTVPLPLADNMSFYAVYAQLSGNHVLADIRDFFPGPPAPPVKKVVPIRVAR